MDVGHEIIKKQQFFRRELKERVFWFIRLRWAAALAGLAGAWALHWMDPNVPVRHLSSLAVFMAFYNLCFFFVGKHLDRTRADISRYQVFAHVQILSDVISLFLFILWTGGLASPLVGFVIFHVILAGILLDPGSCYAYAALIIAGLTGLLAMHQRGLVPTHGTWMTNVPFFSGPDFPAVLIPYLAFCATLLIAAFLITSIKVTLRFKGRELMKVSRDLEISNTKLNALVGMVKEIGTHARLQDLLDSATRNAARIMGGGACSIKILERDGEHLRFASTYGLSRDYLAKDGILVSKSAVNRRIMDGSLFSTGHVDEAEHFQFPEDIKQEGIQSMLCLPLKVAAKTLGVFCVYAREPEGFDEADEAFFFLMAELTAMAMERLNREKAKTWFMNKAAHQLRSPLGTLQSMMKMLTDGFLGPLTDRQMDTVKRCLVRLAMLRETVNDLLLLAEGRREDRPQALTPVGLNDILAALSPAFQARAREKGLELDIRIPDNLPWIMGREKLLDDLFTNLVSNALKYTPHGGRVAVTLSTREPGVLGLEVSDTGIGISEEDVPRLGSEFFRSQNAREWSEEGTGLGLVIVREIIEILGGSIRIVSELEKGTTVTCLIPTVGE